VALSVILCMLFPTTFFLSSTALEYLEDGNIDRALRLSLFYTGIAAALITALYFASVVASPWPRLVRYHQRSSPAIEIAAPAFPAHLSGVVQSRG